MNLPTLILGVLLVVAMFFAARHVWYNILSGKHDCCGCTVCDPKQNDKKIEKSDCGCGCPACNGHKV